MIALLIVTCLLLAGCGGGGGGGNAAQIIPPLVAAVQRLDMLFFYYGCMGAQVRETAAHVNTLMPDGVWGEPYWTPEGRPSITGSALAQMEQAVAAGVTKIVLPVGFLIFDPHYSYQGTTLLTSYVEQLKARGLWGYVVALYPCDEPELYGIDNGTMTRINTDLKQFSKPIATIYTDRKQWPGLTTCDWAGFDKYGVDYRGDGVLADLKGRLRPEQRILLVAGGADPWRDNVRPVLSYANSDPQVIGIVAFLYGEHAGNKGIRDNGMQPEYVEVGAAIKTGRLQ